jgi:hypothetical protein
MVYTEGFIRNQSGGWGSIFEYVVISFYPNKKAYHGGNIKRERTF